MTHIQDYEGLPQAHRTVIDDCIYEAWRNLENGDSPTTEDIAADIAQFLVANYKVVTYPADEL